MGLNELKEELYKIARVKSAISLLQWDLSTYMPPRGISWRAEVLGELTEYAFSLFTSEKMGELIEKAQEIAETEEDLALIRLTKKEYEKYKKIPKKLFIEFQKERARTEKLWEEARKQDDFLIIQEGLSNIVKMLIEIADCIGYEKNRYDALLDEYEPGFKTEKLKELCSPMRVELSSLLEKIEPSHSRIKALPEICKGPFPINKQKELCHKVLTLLGFDFSSGRLDESAHPFTEAIGINDVRITTRYSERDFSQALFAVLHECGHALYDLNIPKEFFGLPIGEGASSGFHESQARFWENFIGRSLGFLAFLKPTLDELFPSLKEVKPEELWQSLNKVQRSLIRVNSDEVTYNLHIILRFELEEALINENLRVSDLPCAWNEKVEDYLGLKPKNVKEGVLQDIHWAAGLFGYFPSYMLGNIYAGQIFWKVKESIPDMKEAILKGKFNIISDWLKENIYSFGKIYEPLELIRKVSGEELSYKYLLDYLREKFFSMG
ncbi:MAG: carboxypeptidase M32 [Synergistetes bacterium]|uniref:Metal-dependent carboxypeptidase n=1 Tax=Thermotoga petrophila TaxID=93929 RepID=A0A124FG31_9THEM|nr:MAG: Thermostable carboxypeptidase 1 [Thermotoga petrophila]MBC7332068.1 carboxypeptidase M32 [Synergistota bacterium]MDK2870923.1 carboxypeptidase Taq [bacterium]